MDLTTRVNLVRNLLKTKEFPIKTGAELLGINRTSVYYNGTPISQEELECKAIIDHLHTDNPAWGARQIIWNQQWSVEQAAEEFIYFDAYRGDFMQNSGLPRGGCDGDRVR